MPNGNIGDCNVLQFWCFLVGLDLDEGGFRIMPAPWKSLPLISPYSALLVLDRDGRLLSSSPNAK